MVEVEDEVVEEEVNFFLSTILKVFSIWLLSLLIHLIKIFAGRGPPSGGGGRGGGRGASPGMRYKIQHLALSLERN